MSRQHLTRQHLFILAISQLLLNQFGPNINGNGSFQVPSLPDAVCLDDICPGNIWLGDIYTYQQYILCACPKFYQTFWTHFFWGKNFSRPKFCHLLYSNIFKPKVFLTRIFWSQYILGPNFLLVSNSWCIFVVCLFLFCCCWYFLWQCCCLVKIGSVMDKLPISTPTSTTTSTWVEISINFVFVHPPRLLVISFNFNSKFNSNFNYNL